jgi:hypothetical protein
MSPWLILPLVLFVAWAWVTARAIARLRGELGQAESRLARRFYKLQGRVTELDALVRELDFERRRRRGEIRFTGETTLAEAIAVHPRVGEILAAYGLVGSGCSGGGTNGGASLGRACADASLDLRTVLQALASFVENPDAPALARPETARLYHIQPPR